MERRAVSRRRRVERGYLRFPDDRQLDIDLPYLEIESGTPGPRRAIMAGLHPNEVSSMEAAVQLAAAFDEGLQRGSVTILPVVNMPGLDIHSEQICPIDGKNINFCFPGDTAGSFSERLAYRLTQEWSAGADLVVDLHGGDLREDVAKFVMCQLTGDRSFDDRTRRLARCFDADLIVEFAAGQMANAGRACNALPRIGRHAVMAESGTNGRLDPVAIEFHRSGVLAMAADLGLVAEAPRSRTRAQLVLRGFTRISAPAAGRFYRFADVNDRIEKGQRVGSIHDIFGDPVAEMLSPVDGRVLFITTHAIVAEDEWLFGVGEVVDGDP